MSASTFTCNCFLVLSHVRHVLYRLGLAVAIGVIASPLPAWAGNAADLMFALDGTYSVSMAANDDASTGLIPLPFTFNLYGANQTGLYINNNGNLSFGSPFSTFTASGFPVNGFPMVAPFWADVDTRGAGSGLVYHKFFDSNSDTLLDTLVVTWDNVGYFSSQTDKLNTFQVAISDGTNPDMGIGNNVCFSYDDMSWTTGSASGGTNGFGGTPATVGVNAGNGVDFFQFGRFDQPGTAYDGPSGSADGVDYLDNLDFCFSVTNAVNQPPIAIGFPATPITLDASIGEVLASAFSFIGPEIGEVVTITSILDPDGSQADGLTIIPVNGAPATATLNWAPGLALQGNIYNLTFQFEDALGQTNSQSLQIAIVPEVSTMMLCGGSTLVLAVGARLRRRRSV